MTGQADGGDGHMLSDAEASVFDCKEDEVPWLNFLIIPQARSL